MLKIEVLFCSITPTNIGQLSKAGTVLESARPEDSKTVLENWIWARFACVIQGQRQSLISYNIFKLIYCLLTWLTQANLVQIQLSGTVLESSGRADSETVPAFDNWPIFVGVIEQNKTSIFNKCNIIQNIYIFMKCFTITLNLLFQTNLDFKVS